MQLIAILHVFSLKRNKFDLVCTLGSSVIYKYQGLIDWLLWLHVICLEYKGV